MPNDHLRMLVELLRPAGVELARRWLAALLLAPESERAAIVDEVEARIAGLYCGGAEGDAEVKGGAVLDIAEAPVQREGFIEQVTRTYEGSGDADEARSRRSTG